MMLKPADRSGSSSRRAELPLGGARRPEAGAFRLELGLSQSGPTSATGSPRGAALSSARKNHRGPEAPYADGPAGRRDGCTCARDPRARTRPRRAELPRHYTVALTGGSVSSCRPATTTPRCACTSRRAHSFAFERRRAAPSNTRMEAARRIKIRAAALWSSGRSSVKLEPAPRPPRRASSPGRYVLGLDPEELPRLEHDRRRACEPIPRRDRHRAASSLSADQFCSLPCGARSTLPRARARATALRSIISRLNGSHWG